MATQADVRRIALALPGVEEVEGRFAFEVLHRGKRKGFAWVWMERVVSKKPRVPNPGVLAVRVASLAQKDLMLAHAPAKFFTEPHYNGFPAVLVRLEAVRIAELEALVAEAWRCQAPADVVNGGTPKRTTPTRARAKAGAAKPGPRRRGDAD